MVKQRGSSNTHQDGFSVFDGQVFELEFQYWATGCIKVCDMVTGRVGNGSEWSDELNIPGIYEH